MTLLDEFEKNLDDKPQRILRDRINRMDYSNTQSPNRRSSHIRTKNTPRSTPAARSRFTSQSVDENGGIDRYDNENEEIVLLEGVTSSTNTTPSVRFISYAIDGISYILSFILISVWGIGQVGHYLFKMATSKNAGEKLIRAGRVVKDFTSSKLKFLYTLYTSCSSNMMTASRRYYEQVDISSTISSVKLKSWYIVRTVHEYASSAYGKYLVAAYERVKAIGGRQNALVVYRIKSFLISFSILWLAIVIIMTSRAKFSTTKSNRIPQTDESLMLPLSVDLMAGIPQTDESLMLPLSVDLMAADLDSLKGQVKLMNSELESKTRDLNEMADKFDQVMSLMKSLQLEQEMSKILLADSIEKVDAIEDSITDVDLYSTYGPDYSLASAGAFIDLEQTSSSFYSQSFVQDILQLSSNSGPQQVLNPSLDPGTCWGLKGTNGNIEIVLPRVIQVTALVVKHAHPKQLFSGAIKSAPRDIEVYGRIGTDAILLGSIQFDPRVENTFVLPVESPSPPVDRIIWKIKDNWGNPEWSCIYRLGVHGKEFD